MSLLILKEHLKSDMALCLQALQHRTPFRGDLVCIEIRNSFLRVEVAGVSSIIASPIINRHPAATIQELVIEAWMELGLLREYLDIDWAIYDRRTTACVDPYTVFACRKADAFRICQVRPTADLLHYNDSKHLFYPRVPFDPKAPTWALDRVVACAEGHNQDRFGMPLPMDAYRLLHSIDPDAFVKVIYQWGWPHISGKGKFVFTRNDSNGRREIVTPIKPGKWLRQHLPQATDQQVKDFAAIILDCMDAEVHRKPMSDADAAEIIEEVYTSGPNSCMSYTVEDRFGRHTGGVHPITVFAHPESDVVLYWVTNSKGSIVARCLARPTHGSYVRIYSGDSSGGMAEKAIMAAMDADGAHKEEPTCLTGAICQRIEAPCGSLVMPYVDYDNLGFYDHDDHLVVANGDDYHYKAYYETGLDDGSDRVECAHCGELFDEDDMHSSYDGLICTNCRADHYVDAYDENGHRELVQEYDAIFIDCVDEYVRENHCPIDAIRRGAGIDIVYSHPEGEYILEEDAVRVIDSSGDIEQVDARWVEGQPYYEVALGAPEGVVQVHDNFTTYCDALDAYVYDDACHEYMQEVHGVVFNENDEWVRPSEAA